MSGESVLTGEVKWFSEAKGYGFILRDDGEPDLFVHFSGIEMKGFRQLKQGERVEFKVGRGEKGPKAVCVRVVETSAP